MSLRPISCNFIVSLGEFVALLDLCRQFCFISGQLICMYALNSCNEFFVHVPLCMTTCNVLVSWQYGVVTSKSENKFSNHTLSMLSGAEFRFLSTYKTAHFDRRFVSGVPDYSSWNSNPNTNFDLNLRMENNTNFDLKVRMENTNDHLCDYLEFYWSPFVIYLKNLSLITSVRINTVICKMS